LALEAELLTLQQGQDSVFLAITSAGGQKEEILQNSIQRKLWGLHTEEGMIREFECFVKEAQDELDGGLDSIKKLYLEQKTHSDQFCLKLLIKQQAQLEIKHNIQVFESWLPQLKVCIHWHMFDVWLKLRMPDIENAVLYDCIYYSYVRLLHLYPLMDENNKRYDEIMENMDERT
jgi:hypothetical protein